MDQPETLDSLNPILILELGGRSGTTLLMQLLGTSPQIAFDRVYPFEVRYLTYLLRWAKMLGEKWQKEDARNPAANVAPPGPWLGTFPYENHELWNGEELWPRCFAAAWSEFSRLAVARIQAESRTEVMPLYYAEKTPPWVPNLLRLAIPCKLVLLVRDPRDIFLSITAFDKKRGYPGFGRRADDDDWAFARRFVQECQHRFVMLLEEEADPHNILITYERLVLNLENESRRLSQLLRVNFDTSVVEKSVPAFAHHMTSNSPRESIERWRRDLPPDLNQFFLNTLGMELKHFGYET